MHSYIIQIETKPVTKGRFIKAKDLARRMSWLAGSDYTQPLDGQGHAECVKGFLATLKYYGCAVTENSVQVTDEARQKFLDEAFNEWSAAREELKEVTRDSFQSEGRETYKIDLLMAKLNAAYSDRMGVYVDADGEVQTLADFIRAARPTDTWYIGATIDYHA